MLCAVGTAIVVGGFLVFIYALTIDKAEWVFGVVRDRSEVGTVGILTIVVGSALLVGGWLMRRTDSQ